MVESIWRKGKLFGFMLLAGILLMAKPALADSYYPYEIQGYDVTVKVGKDNVYHVTERLQVNFNQARHGIYRDIPVINNVSREDGSTSRIQARVTNIKTYGEKKTVGREGSYCRIQLGDKNKTLVGEHMYHISYDYNMGKDVRKGEDEFYYNIIGTSWDTTIQNVTFHIMMPEDIDESKVGMAYGESGSTNNEGLQYTINGKVMEGYVDPSIILNPGEAVTVRMVLPDGYYDQVKQRIWPALISILLSLAAAGAAFLLWWKVGRDNVVVETIQFHPPKEFNSVEAAFAYKGKVDANDVISLLVYLAQKGYIEIVEGQKGLFGNQDFTIRKLKEYDGNNEIERAFMKGLFRGFDITNKDQLKDKFYKTVNKILKMVNTKQNRQVLFYANSINKHLICYAMMAGIFFLATYLPIYDYTYNATFSLTVPIMFGFVLAFIIRTIFSSETIFSKILSVVMSIAMISGYCLGLRNVVFYTPTIYRIAFVLAIIACGVIMFFDYYMPKRTEYGTEVLGRLQGFRTFLQTAEKDRLETMVEREPQYFYNILPYAYVLDVSDIWMEKFESIAIEPPQWYSSHGHYNTFDTVRFHHFMNTTMRSATAAMTSTPSSKGSGGSGGGHSGGGSGGGGGGSW